LAGSTSDEQSRQHCWGSVLHSLGPLGPQVQLENFCRSAQKQ
jgi:hypothetical protein